MLSDVCTRWRAGFAIVITAAAVVFAPPVVAGELQEAIDAVKQASDGELLAELQRRHEARLSVPVTLEKSLAGRDVQTGLAKFNDAILTEALSSPELKPRVIYGPDDRQDWYEIRENGIKGVASASAALFTATQMQPGPSGTVTLKTVPLGEKMALCKGQTFADQASGAFCSGTLVKEDVVLTAGHCVREISNSASIPYINSVSFVFGYRVETPGSPGATVIPQTQIFKGKQVLAGELAGQRGRDWALVKLDAPVPASVAKPVSNWRGNPVSIDQGVFVVGYPSGLPLKYAPGAQVRHLDDPAYFIANLDTFGGNSGSGVYDAATRELVGVLVRGETDYVADLVAKCNRVNVCPTSGCRGEDVTRISIVPKP